MQIIYLTVYVTERFVSQKPFLGSGSGGDGPFTPQKPFLGEPFTTGPGLLIQKII